MTICIASICKNPDSVIMISDSMITSEYLSIQFEHKTPKLIRISDNCVVATAGDALAHTELLGVVKEKIEALKSPLVSDIVECIKNCYKNARLKEIEEKIITSRGFPSIKDFYEIQRELVPDVSLTIQKGIDKFEYGLDLLVGGIDLKGAHIYQIGDPGTSASFDAIGYNAIGSGLPHAMSTFITSNYHYSLPLNEALFIAYKAKKLSEKAPGVGSNVTNVCIIDNKGIREFSKEQVNKLNNAFELRQRIYTTKITENKEWENEINTIFNELKIIREKN